MWRFPLRLGGRDKTAEVEHESLLNQLSDGFDVQPGTGIWAETWAEANAVASVWRINERGANQMIPTRMLEALPTWEEVCATNPRLADTPVLRRGYVAARFKGLGGNSLHQIEKALEVLLGASFDSLLLVPEADTTTYWPAVNPGPPGYEWCSSRCHFGVLILNSGLDDETLDHLMDKAIELLVELKPAWMTFQVGSATGFVLDGSIVGVTIL